MIRDDDLEALLADWLEDGPVEAPDEPVDVLPEPQPELEIPLSGAQREPPALARRRRRASPVRSRRP